MNAGAVKTAAKLFDDFIKLEWQDIFRNEVHVKFDNGWRYVPNGGSQEVQFLRKNVNAFVGGNPHLERPERRPRLGHAGIRPHRRSGWDRVHLGMVADRPKSSVGQRGISGGSSTHQSGPCTPRQDALSRAQARAREAQRAAEAKDDAVVSSMNARRAAQGKEPLSEAQETSVREDRRNRRASAV